MKNIWDKLFWSLNDQYIGSVLVFMEALESRDEVEINKAELYRNRLHAACIYCRQRYFKSNAQVNRFYKTPVA